MQWILMMCDKPFHLVSKPQVLFTTARRRLTVVNGTRDLETTSETLTRIEALFNVLTNPAEKEEY